MKTLPRGTQVPNQAHPELPDPQFHPPLLHNCTPPLALSSGAKIYSRFLAVASCKMDPPLSTMALAFLCICILCSNLAPSKSLKTNNKGGVQCLKKQGDQDPPPSNQVQLTHHCLSWWQTQGWTTGTKMQQLELSRLCCTLPQAQPFPCTPQLLCGFWLNAHFLCLWRPDTIFGRCKLRANIKRHTPTCAFEFNYSLRQILQTTSITRHDLFRA